MKRMSILFTMVLLTGILVGCSGGSAGKAGDGPQPSPSGPTSDRVGTVDFPVSCNDTAAGHMEHGLAMLHNMMYEDADLDFGKATEADPGCALAWWGRAMTLIHPLWNDPPTDEEMARGREFVAKAQEIGPATQREAAYIAAVAAYYQDAGDRDESKRLARFAEGWRSVHERFPDDPEAAALHALAHMATASPGDKTYTKQKEAGAIVEKVLERIPDHPGAHHYIIHAYDYPSLAEKALEVARSYGTIAPEVAHPLHMPTHIFTRLGLWQESIDWNRRSAAAAWNSSDRGVGAIHHLHALDYLAYAYLQQGRDQAAREVLDAVLALEGPIGRHTASAYCLAAVPARYAVERRAWAEAAELELPRPDGFPWEQFAPFEAIHHFGKGLGAARAGRPDVARQAMKRLAALRGSLPKTAMGAYWAKQLQIQEKSVRAWLLHGEGKTDEAIGLMRSAAALEAETEKHPVTPGELLPASELLGDMLLDAGRPGEALEAYRVALERSPNRLNGLHGAARSAELAGDGKVAAEYYGTLLEVAADADAGREAVAQARKYLGGKAS